MKKMLTFTTLSICLFICASLRSCPTCVANAQTMQQPFFEQELNQLAESESIIIIDQNLEDFS